MAEKQLNAAVVLMGRVDNSVGKIGQALTNIGSYIDQASQKLINFGKESVNVYRDYQDSMLDAEVALSTTYGRGTKELRAVMKQLDTAASQWAASTIFHTDDVANAISEAAHANWDLDKIMEGMPAAMKLAQAGGLDLSTGLDYIIKSANAAGIAFEDMGSWIDEWVYAANSSAGTVDQFGEAMLKMGSTMKFAGNRKELLTMLAVLHDAGTTGSAAGTLLRNAMIRLVNPTKAAADAMSGLGFTEDEIEGAMTDADGTLAEVNAQLKQLGFSAYDSQGNLKDFASIFTDLYAVTKGMSEQDRNKIWGTIFPTRTITGAIALLEAADNNWNGLLDSLNGGKAAGYGDYASETMMSGLTGSIEVFNSKVEELKRVVGENLAPQLKTAADNFGKVVDLFSKAGKDNGVGSGLNTIEKISGIVGDLATNIGNLDPALFDALMSGLGEIATLGPTLLMAGGALKGIGWAMSMFSQSTIGKIILVAGAVAVMASALKSYNDAKFLENFGDLEIDTTVLDAKLKSIADAFDQNKAPIEQFATALDDCVKNYETASTTLSKTMMEDLLGGQTLSGKELDDKLAEYKTLGSKMVGAVKDGITASTDMGAQFWETLFRGETNQNEGAVSPIYQGILLAMDKEKTKALEDVTAIGKDLEEALVKAWTNDGQLDETEREQIKEKMRQLNQAIAEAQFEAQQENDAITRRLMMNKLQNLSFEQAQNYIEGTINPEIERQLDYNESHYGFRLAQLETWRDKALERGDTAEAAKYQSYIDGYTDENGVYWEGARQKYENARSAVYAQFEGVKLAWLDAVLADSDLAEGNNTLNQIAGWFASGQLQDLHEASRLATQRGVNSGMANDLQDYYQKQIALLGGAEAMKSRIAAYNASGDTELMSFASKLTNILAAYAILTENMSEFAELKDEHEQTAAEFENLYDTGYFSDIIQTYLKHLLDTDFDPEFLTAEELHLQDADAVMAGYLKGMIESISKNYDVERIVQDMGRTDLYKQLWDDYATAVILGMDENQRAQYALGAAAPEQATAEANAAREAAQGEFDQPIEAPLDIDGTGPAQTARTEAESVFSSPIQATLSFLRIGGGGNNTPEFQAYGGRATGPSLIAERGIPEWYIPEEHTPNTARLIAAAARNSGFDLIDLVEYAGGRAYADGGTSGDGSVSWGDLNENGGAGIGSSGDTFEIEYSPVIHADNADGVGRALQQDKERLRKMLEKLLEEKEMYESMVSYA